MAGRLALDAEHLIADLHEGRVPRQVVIVVGSGYGAAVAAERHAEAGYAVIVLERGREYAGKDFPSQISQLGAHLRMETSRNGRVTATGYDDALFDVRVGEGASALVGNGLGGGSLVNAAVALAPDARVFARSGWPAAVTMESLGQDFSQALAGLGVEGADRQQQSAVAPQRSQKRRHMQALADAARDREVARSDGGRRVDVRLEDVSLTVHFAGDTPAVPAPVSPCIGCGNCCSGCPHDAKLSLDKTYLARAHAKGARLYTQVSVIALEAAPEQRWRVRFVRTSDRSRWERACHSQDERYLAPAAFEHVIEAAVVVLGAGTFGSSEILLRSRAAGLQVASEWLGRGISANGDDLSAAVGLGDEAGGFGLTSLDKTGAAGDSAPPGPTIGSVIRFDDPEDVCRSTVTEDGTIPAALSPIAREIMTTLGVLPGLTSFPTAVAGRDPLVVNPGVMSRSLALLGMGHDRASGEALLDAAGARCGWRWGDASLDQAPALHRQRASAVKSLGADFLPNPASGVLPDEMAAVLSGAAPAAGWVTVHPLGGCRMGENAGSGVVNDRGQVFREGAAVWETLFVLDGSIIPTSLGVNPFLTITALAERAMRLVLGASPPQTESGVERDANTEGHANTVGNANVVGNVGAVLPEVLRGRIALDDTARRRLEAAGICQDMGQSHLEMALHIEMKVDDWQPLWQDARHTVRVVAGEDDRYSATRLVLGDPGGDFRSWTLVEGEVDLFAPVQDSVATRIGRYLRTGITYLASRWIPDIRRGGGGGRPVMAKFREGLALVAHASRAREYVYRLTFSDGDKRVFVSGRKFIAPALEWRELREWLRALARHPSRWPLPSRRSVWQQLTELDITLSTDRYAPPVVIGRLAMDLPDMIRRIVPQLSSGPDTVTAMTAFLSYPLLILRYLLQSRILDFRLPDTRADLPPADPAELPDDGVFELAAVRFPVLALASGRSVAPAVPVCLEVPLRPGLVGGDTRTIRTGLIRYRAQAVSCVDTDTGVRRYRSIILINGFAQNTLPFVAEELGDRSLAAMLCDAGWDVWLLEYRVSPLLRASALFSTMDDIAAAEIPAAVDHVLEVCARETEAPVSQQGEIAVFSHCVGSASAAMSLFGGRLTHPDGSPKVSAILFSQFQPFVIGSATAQMRVQVAGMIAAALGRDFVQFTAGIRQSDSFHALLDRLFASFHQEEHERCPGQEDLFHDHPDTATCRRMTGLLSRLFRHDQLVPSMPGRPGTHARLDRYFGRTNLGVFIHGAKCVQHERLVDADGQNVYLTEDNIRRFMPMPCMLMHGEDNVLFDIESLEETARQCRQVFGPARTATGLDRTLRIPGHAHFDCTIGRRAPDVVFAPVLEFFDKAIGAETPTALITPRLRARLPRSGPLMGWTRREHGRPCVRVWAEIDNSQADTPVGLLVWWRRGTYAGVQVFKPQIERLEGQSAIARDASPDDVVMFATGDVMLPEIDSDDTRILVLGLHRYNGSTPDVWPEGQWPADWGAPMTAREAMKQAGVDLAPVEPSPWPVSASLAAADGLPDSWVCEENSAAGMADDALDVTAAGYLVASLEVLLAARRRRARRPVPGTLSRLRREDRHLASAILRPSLATLAPDPAWRFVAASCRHPGLTGMEEARADAVLASLAAWQATCPVSLMWMLGDQVYADARGGLMDGDSSFERLLPRYRQAFSSAGFRAVSSRLPLAMLMDDHEIEDNWSPEDARLDARGALLSENAHKAFRAFQASHGPHAGKGDGRDGLRGWTMPGAAFLALDTRSHRQRLAEDVSGRRVIRSEDLSTVETWLMDREALAGPAPKFILSGSVFAPGLRDWAAEPAPARADNWQLAPAQRRQLLSFIARHRIRNVVFLAGDYHCGAHGRIRFSACPGLEAFCLVAPSLYAPFDFANVRAADILATEAIELEDGKALVEAHAVEGDGWLSCRLTHEDSGEPCLEVGFHDASGASCLAFRWTFCAG